MSTNIIYFRGELEKKNFLVEKKCHTYNYAARSQNHLKLYYAIEPGPSISYKIAYAPSEDSDQSANPRSLI